MIRIIFKQNDTRFIFLTGDKGEIMSLQKHLNKIPQYQLLPNFKGIPRPEVFLNQFMTPKGYIYYCSSGLLQEVIGFCDTKGITYELDGEMGKSPFNMPYEDFKAYVGRWQLNIEPREYQLEAAYKILCHKLSLSELATRAGKTLIFYMIARTCIERLGAKKVLMIVPSIHLVKQGIKDLEDYKDFFIGEQIWANGEYVSCSNLTIATFQSLAPKADKRNKKYDPSFFDQYDVVCVDECHKLPCKSIQNILGLEFGKHVLIKFGFTGTLPKANTIEWFSCQALMGPKIQEIRTMDLVDEGFLAKPYIIQYPIKHPNWDPIHLVAGEYLVASYVEEDGKKVRVDGEGFLYKVLPHEKVLPKVLQKIKEQYDVGTYHDTLINILRDTSKLLKYEQLIVQLEVNRLGIIQRIYNRSQEMAQGNTIIFAHHTAYIETIKATMEGMFPGKVKHITGSTSIKKRQAILQELEAHNDLILVASYGVMSTGVTLKNIQHAIFAESFKSNIINLQSIGRGLLRTEEKDKFYIHDLVDILPTNKIRAQGAAKRKIYIDSGFEVSTEPTIEIDSNSNEHPKDCSH